MQGTTAPLAARLPPRGELITGDDVFTRFLEYVTERNITMYPAQEDALLEILAGRNVILNTPTGSGKSLVATAKIFRAMCEGRRSIYTCPIKALVSEKFFSLCDDFGPENVGMLTGDAAINRDAPILCCTAEILMSMCLREGYMAPVDDVIMDEFHYYADKERGVAWQVPLLVLSGASFLLMSATLGDTTFFEKALESLTGRKTVLVKSSKRPVPLDFTYSENALHETIADLIRRGLYPIYLVNFTQRACAEEAQNLMSVDFSTKEEKRAIAEATRDVSFDSPYGKEMQKFVRHGLGLHHAGLLPRYRLMVEKLAQQGMLKVISGTDTLGVGVNVPIRTVLFTKLCKFDGEKTGILSVRDFQQISGRAGRKGFDTRGMVVAQAPEHVIENLKLEAKAGDDPAKKRKIVRRKPPEKGYVHWDRSTFDRLVNSQPEPLVSRFRVSHAMVLNVLQRPGTAHTGCRALRRIVRASHGTQVDRRRHGQTALMIFKSLIDAGIIVSEPRDDGRGTFRLVREDLQVDFNIHHTLSMWLLDTLPKLDRESPTYALDVLSLCESVVENPDAILMRQLDRIKREAMADMKANGIEFDERIARLDKLEYPKPNREFTYDTFNAFAAKHPWLGEENIRPKSVAREMFESYHSFHDYVKEYDLHRVEGVLLRYLSDVYKVLVQTVPLTARDPEVLEIIGYFRTMLTEVDSSLLDEWARMHELDDEESPPEKRAEEPEGPPDITRNRRAFVAAIRRTVFNLLRALANGDWETAARRIDGAPDGGAWTPAALDDAMKAFFAEHRDVRMDHGARAPQNTRITEEADDRWRVAQVISDHDEDNDWLLEVTVDLPRSRAAQRPVLTLERIGT